MDKYERIALEELVQLARSPLPKAEDEVRLKAAQTLLSWIEQRGGERIKEEE